MRRGGNLRRPEPVAARALQSLSAMGRLHRSRLDLLFAAALFACGGDAVPTLGDLAHRDGVRVESAITRDRCRCPCAKLVCWHFSCSDSGCSIMDEYELTVTHGAATAAGECPEGPPELTAKLFASEAEPIAPHFVSGGCGTSFTWRMPRARFDPASSHRVEIADETATWAVDGAFAPHPATILAPASAASPEAGAPRVVDAGATMVVGVSPPVSVATTKATIRSALVGANQAPSALPSAMIDADHIGLTIPANTAPGRYDVAVHADVVLVPDACHGPPLCRGVAATGQWDVRVDGTAPSSRRSSAMR
jgi:hypothetical protein